MSRAYYYCYNLTGNPVCGENVTDMTGTYTYCNNLTGSPVCGNKVIGMDTAYQYCSNLTGNPVCGDNVTSIYYTYRYCSNLTGSPVCGNNVTDMRGTYYWCTNLTGNPVCGNNVTNMFNTYYWCTKLTGNPVCGDKVTNMCNAYFYCKNLTGSPICGNNVTNMCNAYYGCSNLNGNAYFYSSKVTDVNRCFYGWNTRKRLSIYVPKDSTTFNTCLTTGYSSLLGKSITWENDNINNCYYNTSYSIYIYPVNSVREIFLTKTYNNNASPNIYNTNQIDNTTMQPRTSWKYNGISQTIDNGYMISVPIDLMAVENVSINKVEVNV
jgi:hypothetical protein